MMPGVNSGITDGQRHGHYLSALGILETKSSICFPDVEVRVTRKRIQREVHGGVE